MKDNIPGQKEKVASYQAAYHSDDANKKRALERLKYRRKAEDPGYARKRRDWMLKGKYGITVDDYDQMLAAQNGGCAICTRKPGKLPLHVDHCHRTGVVRGLLCHQCNWYLGTIEGGDGVFTRLINYLEKHDVIKQLKA